MLRSKGHRSRSQWDHMWSNKHFQGIFSPFSGMHLPISMKLITVTHYRVHLTLRTSSKSRIEISRSQTFSENALFWWRHTDRRFPNVYLLPVMVNKDVYFWWRLCEARCTLKLRFRCAEAVVFLMEKRAFLRMPPAVMSHAWVTGVVSLRSSSSMLCVCCSYNWTQSTGLVFSAGIDVAADMLDVGWVVFQLEK